MGPLTMGYAIMLFGIVWLISALRRKPQQPTARQPCTGGHHNPNCVQHDADGTPWLTCVPQPHPLDAVRAAMYQQRQPYTPYHPNAHGSSTQPLTDEELERRRIKARRRAIIMASYMQHHHRG
jgi:hypothetical protein